MATTIKNLATSPFGVVGRRVCLYSPERSEYYYAQVGNCSRVRDGRPEVVCGGFEVGTYRIKVLPDPEERPGLTWTLIANTVNHPVMNVSSYAIHMEGDEEDTYFIREVIGDSE